MAEDEPPVEAPVVAGVDEVERLAGADAAHGAALGRPGAQAVCRLAGDLDTIVPDRVAGDDGGVHRAQALDIRLGRQAPYDGEGIETADAGGEVHDDDGAVEVEAGEVLAEGRRDAFLKIGEGGGDVRSLRMERPSRRALHRRITPPLHGYQGMSEDDEAAPVRRGCCAVAGVPRCPRAILG